MNGICLQDFKTLSKIWKPEMISAEMRQRILRGISTDTRTLKPGEVFWALSGANFDGHIFVLEAAQKGAAAVVVEEQISYRFHDLQIPVIPVLNTLKALQKLATLHRKKYNIPVIAITGTNGKTTTKEMVAWLLQTKKRLLKTQGNLNNQIGVPQTLLLLNQEHEIAVIEMGTNHPGEISLLCSMALPTVGLITNIGRGHLEFFSSVKGVAREKTELFRRISRKGLIFLNTDDENLPRFPFRRKTLWSFSLEGKAKARVTGKIIEVDDHGCGLWELNGKTRIKMQIPGTHNIQNALAACTVALAFGLTEKEIKNALENYKTYDKRMQIVRSGLVTVINDCYNANPDSFPPALQTLKHMAEKKDGRKILVIGDMFELGLESESLHKNLFFDMLDINPDAIFTIGTNSNLAAELLIARGMENVFLFHSHPELGSSLKKFIQKGDFILLKGSRGMQMEKILAYL